MALLMAQIGWLWSRSPDNAGPKTVRCRRAGTRGADRSTWTGRRDHLLLLLMVTTGVRVSELIALTRTDTSTDKHDPHIVCHGKGRKDRIIPLDAITTRRCESGLPRTPDHPPSHCSPLEARADR